MMLTGCCCCFFYNVDAKAVHDRYVIAAWSDKKAEWKEMMELGGGDGGGGSVYKIINLIPTLGQLQ